MQEKERKIKRISFTLYQGKNTLKLRIRVNLVFHVPLSLF